VANGEACKAYVPPAHQGQAMLVPAVVLDQVFDPPQRWVRSAGYPEGATMAVKSGPAWESKQIATLPYEFAQYLATGLAGDFLQVVLELDGVSTAAFVLHRLRDLVLLEPAPSHCAGTPAGTPQPRQLSLQQEVRRGQQQEQLDLQHQQQRAHDAAAAARAAADAAERAAEAARMVSDVRVDALEAKVSAQEQQIRALQAELGKLRAHLASASSALATAATP